MNNLLTTYKFYLLFGSLAVIVVCGALHSIYRIYRDAAYKDALAEAAKLLGVSLYPPGEPQAVMRGTHKERGFVFGGLPLLEDPRSSLATISSYYDLYSMRGLGRVCLPGRIKLHHALPAGLHILAQSPLRKHLSPLPLNPGAQHVVVGVDELDARLAIAAQDVDAARSLLGREDVRAALRDLLRDGGLEIAQDHISTTLFSLWSGKRLVEHLDKITALANALDQANSPLSAFGDEGALNRR